MADDPGELLGVGRAADVYDQGDGTVLRRYRVADHHATELEGRLMMWVRDQGVSVPAVHRAGGTDIVMDLVAGPTMMAALEERPWLVVKHARLLATLQKQINDLEAPEWFPSISGVTAGPAVLHLDLHPMNVILAADGPVIIDWTNACRGAASFDAAMTYVLGSTFEVAKRVEQLGQRVFVEAFAMARGRRWLRASLDEAAQYRLLDPNITAAERASLNRMLD